MCGEGGEGIEIVYALFPLKKEMILISLPFFVVKSRVYNNLKMYENRFWWHLGGMIIISNNTNLKNMMSSSGKKKINLI